jgi:RNA polymerase sigma factor (sigma-70 family)
MNGHHSVNLAQQLVDERLAVAGARRRAREVVARKRGLERLLKAAAAGDGAAWSALVERFAPRVRAVARSHRLSPHEVEDVVQTTWLRLIEHIGQIRDAERLGGWLATTAQRESLRAIRRGGRELPAEDVLANEPHTPELESRLVARERRIALAAALGTLSERQRALLAMVVLDEGASYGHVSASLGIPVGSIGPTRGRCLDRLRRDPRLAAALED